MFEGYVKSKLFGTLLMPLVVKYEVGLLLNKVT